MLGRASSGGIPELYETLWWDVGNFLMDDPNLGIGSLRQIATVRIRGAVGRDAALATLAGKAVQEGWARPGYAEALIAREAAYPTGLHAAGLDIAIPHADAEWTLVPSMIIGILEEPAEFQPMGGQGPEVKARFILLLVIPDADTHVEFLRALSGFIEDERRLAEFGRTQDVALLTAFLRADLEPPAAEAAEPRCQKPSAPAQGESGDGYVREGNQSRTSGGSLQPRSLQDCMER